LGECPTQVQTPPKKSEHSRQSQQRLGPVRRVSRSCGEFLDTETGRYACSLGGKKAETPLFLRNSLASALDLLSELPTHRGFVIGGASLYTDTLALPPSSGAFVNRVLLTRISYPTFQNCDVHLPNFLSDKNPEGNAMWTRAQHEELEEWTGMDVPQGVQIENGVEYEFQMWTRE
jgi:hypothetical protein